MKLKFKIKTCENMMKIKQLKENAIWGIFTVLLLLETDLYTRKWEMQNKQTEQNENEKK